MFSAGYLVNTKLVGKKKLVAKNFVHLKKFGYFLPGGTFDAIAFKKISRQKILAGKHLFDN